jgi:hypothetical protein
MYLIRPVNGSDSVLALSKGKGLGVNREDNSDNISISTLNSVESNPTMRGRDQSRKKKNMDDDLRIQVWPSDRPPLPICDLSLEHHPI